MLRRICILLILAVISGLGQSVSAAEAETFSLTPYIDKISVDVENPDKDPMLMVDGHLDSEWRNKKGSRLPQTITMEFGGRMAKVSRLTINCVNAADDGIKNVDVDYRDENGQWKALRRSISMNLKTDKGSGLLEATSMDSNPSFAGAVRIRINEAQNKSGSFNISEIGIWGTAIEYPKGKAVAPQIDAKCGEIVTLPETVEWESDGEKLKAPVSWEQGSVLCREAGITEVKGSLGGESVIAKINVSDESVFTNLAGHWSRTTVEELALRNVYNEDDMSIAPDKAANISDIMRWFYNGLSISHEYLPERVGLTKTPLLGETDETFANELFALGLIPNDLKYSDGGTMTRELAAQLCNNVIRYEADELKPDDGDEDISATLNRLEEKSVISDKADFRGGDEVTNAEILVMLARTVKAAADTKVYPVPEDDNVKTMPDYTVKVNGLDAGVYLANAFPGSGGVQEKTILGRPATETGISYFDFFGSAEVEITVNNPELGDPSQTVIRPLSEGIKPAIEGNKIRFTLYHPCNISVEPWGIRRPLQIFANPPEKNKPDINADNVRYYGPGVHYVDPVDLQANDTVYIDGGAVVYTRPQEEYTDGGTYYGYRIQSLPATFSAYRDKTGQDNKIENITIRGRGILSGANTLNYLQRHQLLRIFGVKNARVDGIVLHESSAWNMFVAQCDGVYINNIKMVGFYANNDGIDFCDSINGVVENCYAHNADDSFLIKSWAEVYNVHFRNCVVWNTVSTAFGAVCEVIQPISDVSYKDCTVIHSTNPLWTDIAGGIMGIWDNGAADIDGMLFENIAIEDAIAGKEPIKISVYTNLDESKKEHAEVKNIVFKNITIDSRDESIKLTTPFTDGIKDITFENVTINGKKLTEIDDRFSIKNAVDIHIKP